MNVVFTGVFVDDPSIQLTILDGEYITKNKNGDKIQLYMPFDIYYYQRKNIRPEPLFQKDAQKVSRDELLSICLDTMNNSLRSVLKISAMPITIKRKIYYDYDIREESDSIPDNIKIFTACDYILNVLDDTFIYNTDGIIFTPKYLGVGYNPNDTSSKM